MKTIFAYFERRLSESSTWAGFSAALIAGIALEGKARIALIILGVIAVLVPHKGHDDPSD